jgi:hypothetical protein
VQPESNVVNRQSRPHPGAATLKRLSESWFYKHRTRQPTRRELRRQHLIEAVKAEFDDSGGTYGSPKIWIRLVRQGWRVSVNTIAKIMAGLGLVARKVRRRRGLTRPGKRPAGDRWEQQLLEPEDHFFHGPELLGIRGHH